MDEKAIFKFCKEEGCCDACALRYLGLHHPRVYENVKESAEKYHEPSEEATPDAANSTTDHSNGTNGDTEGSEPEAKRRRGAVCTSCLGLLQQHTWDDSCRLAKEMMDRKGYDCATFACALSAPVATILRERYMQLAIKDNFPACDTGVTSLKEAWKWSFGTRLAGHLGLALDSGAVCPLLITLHYEYPDDGQELEILKSISPSSFAPHKRPAVDVTRRGAEQALARATLPQLRALPAPAAHARCVATTAARAPLYIGGRYIKLSRHLPQTPWLLRGKRMMESSVQEIIFQPIADLYNLAPEEMEHRMKFVSAGREDVDVRCLGEGRPFAIEISDPRRELTAGELARACEQVSTSGTVIVKHMAHVTRDDLTELKRGEESKCKEYEALCIKLDHSTFDETPTPDAPVVVTATDIERINTYTNTDDNTKDANGVGDKPVTTDGTEAPSVRIRILQKTPLRVLHRRPLLTRERAILDLQAYSVPDHPALFRVRVVTTAGTYVKEWVHGELGRAAPALGAALGARADVLALDVTAVLLPWPPGSGSGSGSGSVQSR